MLTPESVRWATLHVQLAPSKWFYKADDLAMGLVLREHVNRGGAAITACDHQQGLAVVATGIRGVVLAEQERPSHMNGGVIIKATLNPNGAVECDATAQRAEWSHLHLPRV